VSDVDFGVGLLYWTVGRDRYRVAARSDEDGAVLLELQYLVWRGPYLWWDPVWTERTTTIPGTSRDRAVRRAAKSWALEQRAWMLADHRDKLRRERDAARLLSPSWWVRLTGGPDHD
jgi:hypothetical protein